VKVRQILLARRGLFLATAVWLLVIVPISVMSAPYAAVVMDARSGKILHSRNANTRLHPASLTKMMTLYVVFEAIRHGEITEDTLVKISRNASREPPSKLGLKAGQKIKLRYLIRAAAVKSANDAATALGEAISGSEEAFANRMTRTAKRLGMTRTTFKNAHGLTQKGHLSTAHDMTILGRHLLYDYNQYYNLFSRRTTTIGKRKIANTNRRLLANYKGADGIKTGYTQAAGFNLVASAERGKERIIATVFGGRSTSSRNARVAELLNMGFKRAPTNVAVIKPRRPAYPNPGKVDGHAGISHRTVTAVKTSLRPKLRPFGLGGGGKDTMQDTILAAVTSVQMPDTLESSVQDIASMYAGNSSGKTAPLNMYNNTDHTGLAENSSDDDPIVLEVVTRISTSGGRHWGINVGNYRSRGAAEAVLLRTVLSELGTLEGSLRKVVAKQTGFDANFYGMTRDAAALACRRLAARKQTCSTIGPG
jgi:D-alanyl-D-alanine carboxypeptidase|tara:strand:+ start:1518 stop:2954 length:1437 start_codon:yes stop_codon:yes gene_type:complete